MYHIMKWSCIGKLMLTAQCIFCGMFAVVCSKLCRSVLPYPSVCCLKQLDIHEMDCVKFDIRSTKIVITCPCFFLKWRAVTGCHTRGPTCLSAIWSIICKIFIILNLLCSLCSVWLKNLLYSTYSIRFIFSSQKLNLQLHGW
jgi:hypothetical protein